MRLESFSTEAGLTMSQTSQTWIKVTMKAPQVNYVTITTWWLQKMFHLLIVCIKYYLIIYHEQDFKKQLILKTVIN